MGRFKIEPDRVAKSILRERISALEAAVKRLETVAANLIREIVAKPAIERLMGQPGAVMESGVSQQAAAESPAFGQGFNSQASPAEATAVTATQVTAETQSGVAQ